jgi:ligand-binding sensor domain-containing protein
MRSYKTFILLFSIILIDLLPGCKSDSTNTTDTGKPWVTYSKAASTNMLDDNIHAIHIIQSEIVVFGTDSGVIRYQSGVWDYYPPDTFAYTVNGPGGGTAIEKKVKAITQAYDMSYWFGLGSGGIKRYNPNSSTVAWQKYNLNATIYGMAASSSDRGSVWIATNVGAYEYIFPQAPALPTDGHFAQAPSASTVQSTDCRVAIEPSTGNVYFGTVNASISYYDFNDEAWHSRSLQEGYKSPITGIAVDYSGTIWCGKQTGVTFYNPGQDTMYNFTPDNTSGMLPSAMINAIETDFLYKTRWFGTSWGLAQLKDTTWTLFTTSNTPALPSNNIQALAYDMVKRNLWIGTDKGVAVYNEGGVSLK